ncbi:hypothetical protein [Leuconostoc citreum]|uniref:hypothetical protein n=1 Tax=Leuconostoc citreum TaxID=33964 RepID=UPI001C20056B|nr:hypothetical protein [Leuconostoc citreum]MBU7451528.1 hypothetical protein [Leuconostoc citreum]
MKNIGILNLLTLVFILLKVLHVITWSWFLVLLPTIISFGLGILFFVVILIVSLVTYNGHE